jgi:serine/threonine-protein kinase
VPLVACPKCEYEFDARVASCPKCGEAVTSFVRQHAGTLVDGKYRVLKRLGRGGMGEVFKAEHVHLGTTRVIKVMRPQIADDKELQTRFLREAKLATLIQHTNVATLHDFSVLPDQTCYMVWEYIEGTNLAAYASSGQPPDTPTILELMIQALQGLQAIHDAGIVHRDISPENIMVASGSSGIVVKLIDLGIAKSDSADGSLTSTGVFIGKWRYASPEHLGLLEPGETIDGRADIFSMGIVLYELLTGQLPFQAETPGQYVLLHAGDRPNPVSPDRVSVPDAPGLEAVLAKMLERDRAKRFATAGDVIKSLEGVLRGMQEHAEAPPTMVLTPKPAEVPSEATTGPAADAATERTESGAPARPASSRTLLAVAAVAGALAVVIAAVLVVAVFRLRNPDRVPLRARISKSAATPAGEVVEIPAEQPPAASETPPPADDPAPPPEPVNAQSAPREPEAPKEQLPEKPAVTVQPETPVTAPVTPKPRTAPVEQKPPPPKATPPPRIEMPPSAREPEPEPIAKPAPVSDTIPTSGTPMFGRRSRRLVDDQSYRSGFKKGIIRDYSDMWSRGGLDWVSLARGIQLSDYRIEVSKFRNMTPFDDPAMMRYLDVVMQEELDDIAGSKGTLTTENALFWAQETPEFAVGIEMIFRDSTGRVVAKIRHVHDEDSLEDAAQEMVDYVVEFVEDHDVVE